MLPFSLVPLLLLLLSNPQIQAQSSCGDCHVANPDAPLASHLLDWEYSAHGRNAVGCEACHGGNVTRSSRSGRIKESSIAATRPAR